MLSLSRQYTLDGQYIPNLFIAPEVRHDKSSYTSTVNDFPDVIKSMLKLFADDAKIYQTTDKCDILQDDLSEGGSWADKWERGSSVVRHLRLVLEGRV